MAALPTRYDTVSDEELDAFVSDLTDQLAVSDRDLDAVSGLARVVDEHLRPRHTKHFDTIYRCYLAEPRFAVRFHMFQCLDRLTAHDPELLDRMLELYEQDHRTVDAPYPREEIKGLFQYLFATKGHQHHWDAVARTANTAADLDMLKALSYKPRETNTNGLDTWLPGQISSEH